MGEWIDCDEEMPDDGVDVLLGWNDDDCKTLMIGFLNGEIWMTIYDEVILTPPTHWMNLPDNPR